MFTMAVTDAQFKAALDRIQALEDQHNPYRINQVVSDVTAIKTDLDNAHTAFMALKAAHEQHVADTAAHFACVKQQFSGLGKGL